MDSRDLYAQLITPPILKPLDWKRSRVRREQLISLGIPVNLDEASIFVNGCLWDRQLIPATFSSLGRLASSLCAASSSNRFKCRSWTGAGHNDGSRSKRTAEDQDGKAHRPSTRIQPGKVWEAVELSGRLVQRSGLTW